MSNDLSDLHTDQTIKSSFYRALYLVRSLFEQVVTTR